MVGNEIILLFKCNVEKQLSLQMTQTPLWWEQSKQKNICLGSLQERIPVANPKWD